jgi:hypothetical protein
MTGSLVLIVFAQQWWEWVFKLMEISIIFVELWRNGDEIDQLSDEDVLEAVTEALSQNTE